MSARHLIPSEVQRLGRNESKTSKRNLKRNRDTNTDAAIESDRYYQKANADQNRITIMSTDT